MTQFGKTRIVYLNHTGRVSGAERVLLNMIRVLDRTEYECCVMCPPNGELPHHVRREGATCVLIEPIEARFTWKPGIALRYAVSLATAMGSLRKRILSQHPDIIHANTLRAGIVATLSTIGSRTPVVWHVHDMLPRHPLSTAIRLIAFLSRRTRLIAVSNACARAFQGKLPSTYKVRTIHNGIDLSSYPLKRPGCSNFRHEIGVPEDAFLICAVGQICARKGLRELLEAFKAMGKKAPHAHLAIVGTAVFDHEQDYRDSLFDLAFASGIGERVHFTGERQDVPAVLQGADLLVLNSQEEPFGLVLVEAMSSGTAVLAARVGGIPEIVKDGQNGWLIAKGDTAALAAKLMELSQDSPALARCAVFARRMTCPQFSLERFGGEIHRFYSELRSTLGFRPGVSQPQAVAAHSQN
jgi:glycosyltransferase involved in cell wall biosynthesis